MSFSRRKFVAGVLPAAISAPLLASCATAKPDPAATVFQHGVASGDPTQHGVILWTRVSQQKKTTTLRWQVSADAEFRSSLKSGKAKVSARQDYTLKVDVQGLQPATTYYYRFTLGKLFSPTGTTKTLPVGDISEVKLGVVSCSNYSFGYFNVYRLLAEHDDLDAIVHLGDYLYEYEVGGYDSSHAERMGRVAFPRHEVVTLNDYRGRHAQYKSDPDLQTLHARYPFVTSWDDHEIANNSWTNGAENHNDGEGTWAQRKADAMQAYYEWMPIREPENKNQACNYRSFQFGSLASLIMLESRLCGRDQGLDYSHDLPDRELTKVDIARFKEEVILDPSRDMLGARQEAWLERQLLDSKRASTPWQVIGNQTIMASVDAPDLRSVLTAAEISALVPWAQRVVEFSRYGLPYNSDGWDAYPVARQRILQAFWQNANNTVVLSGDSHNAWANELMQDERHCAVEIGVPSVTSPGAESMLQLSAGKLETMLQSRNAHIRYSNSTDRGYVVLSLTSQQVQADYYFVDTILSTRASARIKQSVTLAATSGAGTAPLTLV